MNFPPTYISSISKLPRLIQEGLINEAPHVKFSGIIPDSLSFLEAYFVDLGFENLGIPKQEQNKIGQGYAGGGVILPNTGYKFRLSAGLQTIIEPLGPEDLETLPSMPEDWKEAVLTLNSSYEPVHIGSKVRPDQLN